MKTQKAYNQFEASKIFIFWQEYKPLSLSRGGRMLLSLHTLK